MLLANLLPTTIPERVTDASLMAFTGANRRDRWGINRCNRWRHDWADCWGTDWPDLDRTVAQWLHRTVDALTGTFGSRSRNDPDQQDNNNR